MTDSLLQMGLSNACFSLALAIVAVVVGATTKRPHLAHMLWLLVFVKLATPPIMPIPVVTIPAQLETTAAINNHSRSGPPVASSHEADVSHAGLVVAHNREPDVAQQPDASLSARIGSVVFTHGKTWLPPIWLLGSVVVFAWSLVRVFRFGRLLAAESEVAPQPLQVVAVKIARRLGLKTIPTVCTTSARLSPMVWWTGGKVRIVIPAALLDQMDATEWQWILAHELAHVRRRDYLVRWLEWLACVGFWWNPVVWWAQRNLRATEEICCDALVLSCLKPKPHSYANSLLTAVEFLASPALRPPAMASEINSGGFLERRFGMIVSETPNRVTSRWLQACVLLCAMVVLPLGLACAQDYEAVAERLGQAVEEGQLTHAQADAMLATLKKKMVTETGNERELDAYFERVWVKLQAAVAEGKMSAEDAEAKMGAIKKAKMGDGKKDADYKAIGKKIKAAVQAGKLTEDEAKAKWAAIKKAAGTKERKDIDPVVLRKRLGAAIEAGRMTKEEARAKFAEIMKQAERGSERITREDLARAAEEIRKAVAEGKISGKDARARLQGMRRMMAERRGDARPDWEGIKKRIEGAVKSGDMTRDEADAKYKEIRERMAGRRDR
jgi:beta-lactamase regulating signal transducer with metallopeptidase domain/polyhydroxyalkanoate synthesis regulator phasin